MNISAFKKLKKQVISAAIQRIRKTLIHQPIRCISDTADSIHFEFGDYDIEAHRLEDLPTFQIEFADNMVKFTVNGDVLTKMPVSHVTVTWMHKELCHWVSCNLRKMRRHSSYPYTFIAHEAARLSPH